ncbi:hypothetical protein B0H13DRAFT_2685181 [Mycena leptocephala]|nr:hypothetical protein B0H13DRAFT_2685181 [Mycena leptocephala]
MTVKAFTQPSSETATAFNAFASANGLNASVISPNGDWLALTLPVSQADDLFDAQFEFFTHPSMESAVARMLSISLPSELVGHVDVIHPSTEFTRPKSSLPRTNPDSGMQLAKRQASSCNTSNGNGLITPASLQALYGILTAPATHSTLSTNAIIVPEYSNEAAQTEYLAFRPDIPLNTTFTVLSVDGGVNNQTNDTSQPTVEANLDIQYTVGIATGVPVQFLAVGNIGNDNTTFDPFPTAILDTPLSELWTPRGRQGRQSCLQTRKIISRQTDAQGEHVVGGSSTLTEESAGNGYALFEHDHVA